MIGRGEIRLLHPFRDVEGLAVGPSQEGGRLVSLRQIPFPRVSDRTIAFRATLSAMTPQGTVPAYVDVIALMRSRAHATITVGSALTTPPRSEELHLARTVAKRMASAMRGA